MRKIDKLTPLNDFNGDNYTSLEIKSQLEDYGFKSLVNQYCKEEN
jgi:hypothetical protein